MKVCAPRAHCFVNLPMCFCCSDGITDNIKASFKFDSNGFGYKRKVNDWIEENNVYEQILSDLKQHHPNNESKASSNNEAEAPMAKTKIQHK